MTDRHPSHPNFGNEARVEVHGREVYVVLVANDVKMANSLAEEIVEQMKQGSLRLTMKGIPTDVTEQ